MSENEKMEMVKILTEMSEENFQRCVAYVKEMNTTERVKDFLNTLNEIALIERKKTIQTA